MVVGHLPCCISYKEHGRTREANRKTHNRKIQVLLLAVDYTCSKNIGSSYVGKHRGTYLLLGYEYVRSKRTHCCIYRQSHRMQLVTSLTLAPVTAAPCAVMLTTGEQLSRRRTLNTRRKSEEGVGLEGDLNMAALSLFELEQQSHGEVDEARRGSHTSLDSSRPVQVLMGGQQGRLAKDREAIRSNAEDSPKLSCRVETVSQHMDQSDDAKNIESLRVHNEFENITVRDVGVYAPRRGGCIFQFPGFGRGISLLAPRSSGTSSKIMVDNDRVDTSALRGKYWLTRVLFLRCLGFVYTVAFLVALKDNSALVSPPAPHFSPSTTPYCCAWGSTCFAIKATLMSSRCRRWIPISTEGHSARGGGAQSRPAGCSQSLPSTMHRAAIYEHS